MSRWSKIGGRDPLGRVSLQERPRTGDLIAVLTDLLSDGLSMVYSFMSPMRVRSLARIVLDHIEQARSRALPYVYLGYWIDGCRKMSYKCGLGRLRRDWPQAVP
jgi:arginyl-tRNA--protein-N-Asp/Glu arginylyltransferase